MASSDENEELSGSQEILLDAIKRNDAAAVQQSIQNGAKVNYCVDECFYTTPMLEACRRGFDEIVRILLDAGADAWWQDHRGGWSAIAEACKEGHLSTVQLLLNHDKDLLEIACKYGDTIRNTPLLVAIQSGQSEIVRFLLDRGANVRRTGRDGFTALMTVCSGQDLEIMRLVAAADVDVEARDDFQRTALHHAANHGRIEFMRELILHYNANMFVVDKYGVTPFDWIYWRTNDPTVDQFLDVYGNKMTQDHGRLTLHVLLRSAEYSPVKKFDFRPPQIPFHIHLQMCRLTLQHFRTLLHTLDPELIRNRDDSGKLPIHIACRTNAPVEVLALICDLDPATLQIADYSGALPLHECCLENVDYASVRFLVEQGGVGTVAARNGLGALPLHVLCGSTRPEWRTVQYLIQSFPGSVTARTNSGQYPFMVAACEESSASLSVVYELARVSPSLIIPMK
jgi:ankyrin repeat protein